MRDHKLRTISLWVAGAIGILALFSLVISRLQPLVLPATFFIAGLALVLFGRIVFSRFYRNGIAYANQAMQPDGTLRVKAKMLSDPEWGLFGKNAGDAPLLWIRAVLIIGVIPMQIIQDLVGVAVGRLWFSAAFVAMELSLMYVAIVLKENNA